VATRRSEGRGGASGPLGGASFAAEGPLFARDLDVAPLARLFADATTSYKFLFFLALLDAVEERVEERAPVLAAEELATRMLALAWYPSTHCHLSFGPQDQASKLIVQLRERLHADGYTFDDAEYRDPTPRLRALVAADGDVVRKLLRYVPFRTLAPFVDDALRGLADAEKDAAITRAAEARFDGGGVPYRPIVAEGRLEALRVAPRWASYLRAHAAVLRDFTCWHWAAWMRRRNPNVPNISAHLLRPSRRESLAAPTRLWRARLARDEVHCIYTDRRLTAGDLSLDHFLPWSFLGHDEPWNLTPVERAINSSKGNRIPAPEFLDKLARQHASLLVDQRREEPKRFEQTLSHYAIGLRLGGSAALDPTASDADLGGAVRDGFREVFPPLLRIARSQGFPADWRPGAD